MTAQEHPEPTEPPLVMVPGGVYCLIHGEMDCTLPFCWRCGNHQLDDFERCADPRCHATNDALARAIVEDVRRHWTDRPAPLEVLTWAIAESVTERQSWRNGAPINIYRYGPRSDYSIAAGPSSMRPGEPGGGGDDIGVPATGAGS